MCDRLNNGASSNGTGPYQLITNAQWQTMAANITATAGNWSGGSVGNGRLARGHTDNAITDPNQGLATGLSWSGSNALAAASTDLSTSNWPWASTPNASAEFAAGYRGTGNNSGQAMNSGFEQRRTQYLSNGEVIWDVAGNVWEWVRYTQSDGVIDTGFTTPSGATNSASNYNSRYIPAQSNNFGSTNWYEISNLNIFSSSFMCKLLGTDSACTGTGGLNPLWFQPSGSFWNNTSGTFPSDFNLGRIYSVSAGASSTYAVLRGGYWGDYSDAGVFAAALNVGPTGAINVIGFRCAVSP
jgi:formylglycine-generating enzyme required for sulfatase activity